MKKLILGLTLILTSIALCGQTVTIPTLNVPTQLTVQGIEVVPQDFSYATTNDIFFMRADTLSYDLSFDYNPSTATLTSLKLNLGSSSMGGKTLSFGSTAIAGLSGSQDTIYHEGYAQHEDSVRYNYTLRPGYESWLGASINGYIFYDSLTTAGYGNEIKIGPITRMFDTKIDDSTGLKEIAWYQSKLDKVYTTIGRPSEVIPRLHASHEISVKHIGYNRILIYILILLLLIQQGVIYLYFKPRITNIKGIDLSKKNIEDIKKLLKVIEVKD